MLKQQNRYFILKMKIMDTILHKMTNKQKHETKKNKTI